MKKQKLVISIIIGIVILNILIPFSKVYAAEEWETIQFQDRNFYLGMIEILETGKYSIGDEETQEENQDEPMAEPIMLEKDEEKLQIKMKKEDLIKVEIIELLNRGIKNIKGIEKFTNLKYINFFNGETEENEELNPNEISDISYIGNLTKLEYICFESNLIEDLSPVRNLQNLLVLDICYNPLVEDISVIENLKNLQILWLIGTNRTKLPNLKNMKQLEQVYLSSNQLQDVSMLDEMENLKMIVLEGNTITKTIEQNGIQMIPLPQVLQATKNKNSKLYTEEPYILNNCELSKDGKNILINTDNTKEATISIENIEEEYVETNELIISQDHTLKIQVEPAAKEEPKDNTVAPKILPKAGWENVLIASTILAIMIAVLCYILNRKYSKIK